MSLRKKLQNGSICNRIPNWDTNLYDYNNGVFNKDDLEFNKKRKKWPINNHQVDLKNY